MSSTQENRFLRPETLTAAGILIAAALLLIPTTSFPQISALLPAAMLVSLIVLSLILLIKDQMKASRGEAAAPMTKAPKRVLTAFILIGLYVLSVDFIGFYPSTFVSVPLVAYIFGYRSPKGLALATAIVLSAIYLIFSFAMSQQFPTGRLWSLL